MFGIMTNHNNHMITWEEYQLKLEIKIMPREYVKIRYYKGHPKEEFAREALKHAIEVGVVKHPEFCMDCTSCFKCFGWPLVVNQDLDHPLRFDWKCPCQKKK